MITISVNWLVTIDCIGICQSKVMFNHSMIYLFTKRFHNVHEYPTEQTWGESSNILWKKFLADKILLHFHVQIDNTQNPQACHNCIYVIIFGAWFNPKPRVNVFYFMSCLIRFSNISWFQCLWKWTLILFSIFLLDFNSINIFVSEWTKWIDKRRNEPK